MQNRHRTLKTISFSRHAFHRYDDYLCVFVSSLAHSLLNHWTKDVANDNVLNVYGKNKLNKNKQHEKKTHHILTLGWYFRSLKPLKRNERLWNIQRSHWRFHARLYSITSFVLQIIHIRIKSSNARHVHMNMCAEFVTNWECHDEPFAHSIYWRSCFHMFVDSRCFLVKFVLFRWMSLLHSP